MRNLLPHVALFMWALVLPIPCVHAAAAPRLAVWDPQVGTHETRFQIDRAFHDQAAAWLQAGGCAVTRLTAAQVADPSVLRAASFDAYVSAGDAVPRAAIPNLLAFAEQGGVLLALDARIPYLVAIAPDQDGNWTMSPQEPKFAWQSETILNAIGGRYIFSPGLHDAGVHHTATPLLKHYLPDAPDIPNAKLRSNFIPAVNGGICYPLLRSQRYDGQETTPQMWVMRNGKRTAIVSCSARYTGCTETNVWPIGRATLVALAHLAQDLRDNTLTLTPDMALALDEHMPQPQPLTSRFVRGQGVDPEGIKPLARWGRFDGSCIELGQPLAAGRTLDVAADAPANQVPRALEAGAAMRLALPAMPDAPCFLRIRGATVHNGAVLQVCRGTTVLWHEVLNNLDAGGAGNTEAADLKGLAAEFVRIIFVPPADHAAGASLTVANTGSQPVYFDAMQLEGLGKPRDMRVALNAGYLAEALGKDHVPRDITRTWSGLRVSGRTQWIGPPGTTGRWDRCEALLDAALDANPHLELVWEGTAAWDAVTTERYAEGVKAGRPHCVPPDPAKYAEIITHMAQRYGNRIEMFELWNEANGQQFWRGSYDEYADFCKMAIPIIRRLAPQAKIISTGTAGWSDSFFDVLIQRDLMKDIDLVPNHVYAGKSVGWDLSYGVGQGGMYAAGVEKEFYCNEQGFVWKNSEWFTTPPVYTPHLQMLLINKAMARLMASDLAKVSLFHAGGDSHPFGLIDASGTPRPAYAVVADYMKLNNGRRWNVAMSAPDGGSLRGVYEAASLHPDGSMTVVLNPAEVEDLQPQSEGHVNPSSDFSHGLGPWSGFQGKAASSNGLASLTPTAGQPYMGFGQPAAFDLVRWPVVEVSVPACAKAWTFSVRANGRDVAVFRDLPAGVHRADLREAIDLDGATADGDVTFRVTGPTAIAYVHFLPPEAASGVTVKPSPGNLLETAKVSTFYGRARISNGSLTLIPDVGKSYMGCEIPFTVDPVRTPFLDVMVADCTKPWSMTLNVDGRQIPLFTNLLAGMARADLRKMLPDLNRRSVSATFRVQGDMTLKTLQAAPDPDAPVHASPAPSVVATIVHDRAPLPVRLLIPLPQPGVWRAEAVCGGAPMPVTLSVHQERGATWVELELSLPGRTVLTLRHP